MSNQNSDVLCVIQARVRSKRFPRKVLERAAGKALIEHVITRVKKSKHIKKIVLATGADSANEPLREIAKNNGVLFFAGSEDDVLDRFYQAAKLSRLPEEGTVVRITGDCPLIDPQVVDQVIERFLGSDCDYVSNVDPPTFPDGLDVEAFSFKALEKAWKEAELAQEREHVTLFIRNSGKFKTDNLRNSIDLSKERWTVDTAEDWKVVQGVLEYFTQQNKVFGMEDILKYKNKNPELFSVNQHISRNEGLRKSITMNGKFKKSGELLKKALRVTPLGAQTYSRSYRYFCQGVAPSFIERGEGSHVWDADGNEFIDFILSLGAITVGYNNSEINHAILDQLKKGIIFSQPSPISVTLAEKLTKIIPSAEMVRFVKNGSDATSAAVRLARAFTSRDVIIASGYHGWQDWYIASTENHRGIPKDILKYSKSCPYNDLDALKKILKENPGQVAAMIMEPVQGNGPQAGYLEAVKDLLKQDGALLIFDEVVSGFRMGLGGAQGYYKVTPDLSSFGKGMANGMPLSCVVGRAEILKLIEQGVFISTTFGDELLSIASALKTIEILERPGTFAHIWKLGTLWKTEVEKLIHAKTLEKYVQISGLAPHCGVEFQNTPELSYLDLQSVYQQKLLENGILSLGINNFSLSHTEDDVRKFIQAVDQAFSDLVRALDAKSVDHILLGGKIDPIFKRH